MLDTGHVDTYIHTYIPQEVFQTGASSCPALFASAPAANHAIPGVCIYVCMYVYMYVLTYICMYVYMYLNI